MRGPHPTSEPGRAAAWKAVTRVLTNQQNISSISSTTLLYESILQERGKLHYIYGGVYGIAGRYSLASFFCLLARRYGRLSDTVLLSAFCSHLEPELYIHSLWGQRVENELYHNEHY